MAYIAGAIFIETPIFTRQIAELLDDREYAGLQKHLHENPDAGDLVPGGGGLRKQRWACAAAGKGKRGGIRVLYFWRAANDEIYMLYAFGKGAKSDLTEPQKKTIRKWIKENLA